MDIDIVVTWVDGSDPEWLKERARYSGTPVELSDVGSDALLVSGN